MISRKLEQLKACLIILLFSCISLVATASAQTFTSLVSFDYSNGARPYLAALVQGVDGNLYGTTSVGGASGPYGTIFKLTPSGTLTTVYSFGGSDGAFPSAALLLATDGNFYGTTEEGGGAYYAGTIFKMTPAGKLTTLYSFCAQSGCADGGQPDAALIEGSDGNFYGTTQIYGANSAGTVFKITPKGDLTTLYSFCSVTNCADGGHPGSSLIQATNGNFYGTNSSTIFKITPNGKLTTLYTFTGTGPGTALVQANDGNFYGTTSPGTDNEGTVFRVTPNGVLTTLYIFTGYNGTSPEGSLIQATDGNLYGTTFLGGAYYAYGSIFRITLTGTLTTLYSFCAQTDCPDGENPSGALFQSTTGQFYGTTLYGGINDEGTVFNVDAGLAPFIQTIPASGKAGTAVKILGQGLKGTSAIFFNGKKAVLASKSDTYLTTQVPAGATSGFVTVTTSNGRLTSNFKFRVLP
jgi:uncharacterized repeat protein (TIGR03803 family)